MTGRDGNQALRDQAIGGADDRAGPAVDAFRNIHDREAHRARPAVREVPGKEEQNGAFNAAQPFGSARARDPQE
jgi:hypothetical protein